MSNLSKSKYYKFLQCAKAWLQTNKPGEATPDKGRETASIKAPMWDLAMGLLGPL